MTKSKGIRSMSFVWTTEAIEQLQELWLTGMSCSAIAEEMGAGLTRNSVIGKAHRLKLRPRGSTRPPTRGAKRAAKERQMRQRIIRRLEASTPQLPPEPMIEREDAWKPLPGIAPITIMELDKHTCRWPVGEYPQEYCGDKVVRGSYCAAHHRLSLPVRRGVIERETDFSTQPTSKAREYA